MKYIAIILLLCSCSGEIIKPLSYNGHTTDNTKLTQKDLMVAGILFFSFGFIILNDHEQWRSR